MVPYGQMSMQAQNMSNNMSSVRDTSYPHQKNLHWYQEVLSLDPSSRIFLPYAQLLIEKKQYQTAIDVLTAGLEQHPDFLEARLMLIELLYQNGKEEQAYTEASGLIYLLSHASALWKIWSNAPDVSADQAALLLFLGSTFSNSSLDLTAVFKAGIQVLSANPSPKNNVSREQSADPDCSDSTTQDCNATENTESMTSTSPLFVMDDSMPWYSLDSVPEDESEDEVDLLADREVSSKLYDGIEFHPKQDAVDQSKEVISNTEGKSSLCTRSMAQILEEQGVTGEAANIYRELLENSSSPEEHAELNAKLDKLMQGSETMLPQASETSGLINILETLAVRLEHKSRA
jgi:tetratricopeptide (TPR) repeat protein